MHLRPLGAVFCAFLYTLPAQAWFFQPPPEAISEEMLKNFREASVEALSGLMSIQLMLQQLEETESSVADLEAPIAALESLTAAASLFQDLVETEELQALEVGVEAVAEIDESAIRLVRQVGIATASDLARYASDQSAVIAELLERLLELDFGPDTAADPTSRATVNSLVSNVADMLIVVSTVSGALALAQPQ